MSLHCTSPKKADTFKSGTGKYSFFNVKKKLLSNIFFVTIIFFLVFYKYGISDLISYSVQKFALLDAIICMIKLFEIYRVPLIANSILLNLKNP